MNILTIVMTITISLSYIWHISCMDERQQILSAHTNECQQIIAYNREKLEYYKNNATQQDHNKTVLFVKNKFGKYATDLLHARQNTLNAIKQKYTIEPDAWNSCMKLINDIIKFNTDNQHIPLPNIFHDPAIPTDILTLITDTLTDYSINPLRINIVSKRTSEPNYYILNIPMPVIDKGYLEIQFPLQYNPGHIIINLTKFLLLSRESQAALCVSMVEEIAQNAQLIPTIIAMKQTELTNSNEFITESDAFKSLYSICYYQLPLFILSMRNLDIADCLLELKTHNLLTHNGIPIYSEQEYKRLCRINRYWRILEWINQQSTEL